MANLSAVLLLLLAASASASLRKAGLHGESLETIPMHSYKSDCWKPAVRPSMAQIKGVITKANMSNPGAGMKPDELTPFAKIEKDGFFEVECVKDYMFYFGDKFGDNKHDYALGEVSGVSIVHYNAHVAKMDRVEMTQKVCFEFCRTVPDMQAFGLLNGRECYCDPYYKPMASDSSECDAPCDGDNSVMCGGKSKSSIFAMHMCASTGEDLTAAMTKAGDLKGTLSTSAGTASTVSGDMNTQAAGLQASFGKVGDSAAGDLFQAAKVSAGKLEHKGEDAKKVADALKDLKTKGAALSDFTDPAEVTKAERIMEGIEEPVAEGLKVGEELDAMLAEQNPDEEDNNQAKQYYNIMYFVDKEHTDVPQTCSGDAVGEPLIAKNRDECAAACDANPNDCVGFQFFGGKSGDRLCFLFSKFKTATYYTGCSDEGTQVVAQCRAKLSSFEGQTLKPDGSGKCKQCLKEAKNANRCYETKGFGR